MIKFIPLKEYKKMWEKTQGCMRFENPHIDPVMKTTTVQGHSGPGTKFKNEYDRAMHEHFNPSMPRMITMITADGEIIYKPKVDKT